MTDEQIPRVVGIAGGLRRASFNRALLHTAAELAPARLTIDIHDIAPLSLYNLGRFR